MDLKYYDIYQKYLGIYEETLSEYVASLDVSEKDFFKELQQVKNDASIQDKKLKKFVDYLLASTDYQMFYKIMIRATKKLKADDDSEVKADSKATLSSPSSKAQGKSTSSSSSDSPSKASSVAESKSKK